MAASRLRWCALGVALTFVVLLLALGTMAIENAALRQRAVVAEARLASALVHLARTESMARETRAEIDQLTSIRHGSSGVVKASTGGD
jgi:hypothetical protein